MSATTPHHVDVLIVGAGISGIGCAWHLQDKQPGRTYAILENRDAIGGTWDLFRYPGIRSDSDLHTFGYAFKPWTDEKAIADGPDIRAYIQETARENGIDKHIRFGHRVVRAAFDSSTALWTVEARHGDEDVVFTASWLFSGAGYYNYDEGYTPHFEGRERFQGQIVHPQFWPEDLDYAGKKVVVIGSGATAVTLIPSMTDEAEHVTMLQRSPSYIVTLPMKDPIANGLRKVLPDRLAYRLTRRKNVALQTGIYSFAQKHPNALRKLIRAATIKQLPKGYEVDTHFKPKYDPWDQRLCTVPNGDLFRAIRKGKASIVTDHIDTFTEKGILLKSGEELEADIIITATGLKLQLFGGIDVTVDGVPGDPSQAVAYRGLMLSGVPNFAYAVGYTNSSWTLKVDLVCEHLCRLMSHMDRHGYDIVVPEADPAMETRPLLDFAAGYVQRAIDTFPKQGSAAPWQQNMSYAKDIKALRESEVAHEALRFSRRGEAEGRQDEREVALAG
ncbi:flavin-containing monooxygenase [Paraconexibacter sp.]|uniref:flavin-containing monooxygenase n=1 Tax=Paraconexibacter sp. TaxID=2949640 RepID=UPI003566099D